YVSPTPYAMVLLLGTDFLGDLPPTNVPKFLAFHPPYLVVRLLLGYRMRGPRPFSYRPPWVAPGCRDRQRAPRETRTMAKKPEKPEKSEKPEKTEPPEKPEPADLLALVAALHRQHRRLRWTVVMLTLVTLVALAGAGAALLAPYNAELGLYLRRWLGRPETIASEKTILEAEK